MINGMMICNKTKSDIYELMVEEQTTYGYFGYMDIPPYLKIGSLNPNVIDGKIIEAFFFEWGPDYLHIDFAAPVGEHWCKKIVVSFVGTDLKAILDYDEANKDLYSVKCSNDLIYKLFKDNIGKKLQFTLSKE